MSVHMKCMSAWVCICACMCVCRKENRRGDEQSWDNKISRVPAICTRIDGACFTGWLRFVGSITSQISSVKEPNMYRALFPKSPHIQCGVAAKKFHKCFWAPRHWWCAKRSWWQTFLHWNSSRRIPFVSTPPSFCLHTSCDFHFPICSRTKKVKVPGTSWFIHVHLPMLNLPRMADKIRDPLPVLT